MLKRARSNAARTSTLRTRSAVLGLGLGVSTVLGVGAGVAAADAPQASVALPAGAATSVKAQAAAQAKAAAGQQTVKKAAVEAAAKKKAKKKPGWVDPVAKYTLSARFNQAGGMWSHKHSGQDFAVRTGTNVVATHGGTVVKAGGNGAGDGPAYGNAIVIKHGGGLYSQYAHLSRIDVRIGQVVKTGQHIALSGSTGNSSGPHLHFEIRTTPNYGSAMDPLKFLRGKGVTV